MKPNSVVEQSLSTVKKFVPKSLFSSLAPLYHAGLANIAAIRYGFPSHKLTIIGVTGTKGKSSTVEMINAILEAAGKKTALSNTIRFKVGEASEPNLYKMSMPGRGVIQKLMREAINDGCTHMVLEVTSQAVLTKRHFHLDMDALVFTNLSPEHIEAHGSFEKYKKAKLSIARSLHRSFKRKTFMVVNADDPYADEFIAAASPANPVRISLEDAVPYSSTDHGTSFIYRGETITSPLPGEFNISNMLCAAAVCEQFGVSVDAIKQGLESLSLIRGRVENVNEGGTFDVYVDYAHTADSLEKLYSTFEKRRIIAVLGNTGGGRDTWKRPLMAQIAEKYADLVILTNEDPYDEDPVAIVEEMRDGMEHPNNALIELDRRQAIRTALTKARKGDVILITGKGTDPYIMEADGEKTSWDDATVVREELELMNSSTE